MAKKKMSTRKKVAIGVGVAAVIGAILCYFYCPCFRKKEAGLAEGEEQYGTETLDEEPPPFIPSPGASPLASASASSPAYGRPVPTAAPKPEPRGFTPHRYVPII